ncbi:MAG TPA: hypothetical protein VMT46_02940 [Anaerolineaceae bacterium]|nr:hypothetical protein [Anaerolineaceae bacterium]
MSRRTVFLFDLDGVLVEPHGYRLSTKATLDYFTTRMGLCSLYPGEDGIALLESISMTSEWDMVAVILAAIFDALQAQDPGLVLPGDLLAACEAVRARGLHPPEIDYHRLTGILSPAFQPGRIYASLALELCQPDSAEKPFPHLAGSLFLANVLGHTRDLSAATTRIFQHFALGSQAFTQSYQLPAEFEIPSYLQNYDRPLLDPILRERLLERWRAGNIDLAIYTLRANSPRQPDGLPRLAFGREADLVIEPVGFQELPLIGYGEIGAAAFQIGRLPDELCKPSPVHALGAVLAALTREERRSILAAERLVRLGELDGVSDLSLDLEIQVFEDSPGSVNAVRQVGELLNRHGGNVRVHAWGIAANPAKIAALREAGAKICPDVNQALLKALEVE